MQSWSIFIFSYNEEGNIGKVIKQSANVLGRMTNTWEIIIVDDGSTDNSIHEIKPYLTDNITLIEHKKNQGIGLTLIDGYKASQYENVCGIPGDGEFDVNELIPFSEFKQGTMISFYREVKTSYSSYRDLLSMFNRMLNERFLGLKLKDVNWVNVYKNENLKSFKNKLTSSLVETENSYLLHTKGIKIIEVPSKYKAREFGKSKGGSLKMVWQAIRDIFKIIVVQY